MPQPKIINIRENWSISSTVNDDGSFVLTFETPKHCINIHCDRSSLRFISEPLWGVVTHEEAEIADMKAAIKGE
jgi:hypothetical protein